MRITVSADDALSRFAGLLAAFPERARRAMVDGLNEGGDLLRTQARRDLRAQTGVLKAGSITKRTGSRRATSGSLEYMITGSGKGMPIREFRVKAGQGVPVTASPWNVSHTFARSFETKRQHKLMARRGATRFPVRALYGPAVSKEIVKDQTAADFEAQAAPTVERVVIKRLGRLLP